MKPKKFRKVVEWGDGVHVLFSGLLFYIGILAGKLVLHSWLNIIFVFVITSFLFVHLAITFVLRKVHWEEIKDE